MADNFPLRQVLEATAAGGLLGSMFGAISSYLNSPVVVGYNRAPVWRDVSTELFASTKWWAGTFFTYVMVKNLSASVRGLPQPDEWSSFTAGAATGAIYSFRGGISQKSLRHCEPKRERASHTHTHNLDPSALCLHLHRLSFFLSF